MPTITEKFRNSTLNIYTVLKTKILSSTGAQKHTCQVYRKRDITSTTSFQISARDNEEIVYNISQGSCGV